MSRALARAWGNLVRIGATYEPSRDPVKHMIGSVDELGFVVASGKRAIGVPGATPGPAGSSDTGMLLALAFGALLLLVLLWLAFGRRSDARRR